MKKNKRIILKIVSLLLVVGIGVAFRNFVYDYFLLPLAVLFWFLVRLLFFSIHQAVIWYFIIGLVFFLFIVKYLRPRMGTSVVKPHVSQNIHLTKLQTFNDVIRFCGKGEAYRKHVVEELKSILVSHYAARKRLAVNYVLFDQFERGEIELPQDIYAFLFKSEESRDNGFTSSPGSHGGEEPIGEFEDRVERCLVYLENIMEIARERN